MCFLHLDNVSRKMTNIYRGICFSVYYSSHYPFLPFIITHSRILAWRIPWTEEPGGLQSMGSQRIGHNWSDLACTTSLLKVNINRYHVLSSFHGKVENKVYDKLIYVLIVEIKGETDGTYFFFQIALPRYSSYTMQIIYSVQWFIMV